MDELLRDFLTESTEQLESIGAQLLRFEQDPSDARIVANIFRLVHAIKGTCGFLNLPRLERVAHAAETLIDRLRNGTAPSAAMVSLILTCVDRIRMILTVLAEGAGEPSGDDAPLLDQIVAMADGGDEPAQSGPFGAPDYERALPPGPTPPERRLETVRVSVATLERLMSLVSELVLTRNQLAEIARRDDDAVLQAPLQRLSVVAADLQRNVLAARMQPVERLFLNLHRLVRDMASELGKSCELSVQGGKTELDRQLIEALRDPLTQMLRNAIDHGIERPAQRRASGKPETGVIRIRARHESGQVAIEITDDGRGLDLDHIRRRARALGLATDERLATLSEAELCRFAFAPGLSTASGANAISGRGVGLDIVRANIEALGGAIALTSRAGLGARITLRIPLTLAIVPALALRAGSDIFVLPQYALEELVEIDEDADAIIDAATGEAAPTRHLRDLVGGDVKIESRKGEPKLLLRMRAGAQPFAILVDEIIDVQEVVLKPLPSQLRHIAIFSASVILADGSVALVLEPSGLAAALGLQKSATAAERPLTRAKSAMPTRLALFRAQGPQLWALPLEGVAKICVIDGGDIVFDKQAAFVHFDGRSVPLLALDGGIVSSAVGAALEVLILRRGDQRLALAIDDIVDTVQVELKFDPLSDDSACLGATRMRGEQINILNLHRLFDRLLKLPPIEPLVGAPLRVLLFEPSASLRRLIALSLNEFRCDVREVANASQFRAALADAVRFDALVVDLDLAATGEGAFRQGSNERSHQRPALIGLTASLDAPARRRANAAGLDEILDKFDRNALLAALQQIRTSADVAEAAA